MDDLDLTELRRQIDAASPKNGPGRVVKLERGYAKLLLEQTERLQKELIVRRHFHRFVEALAEIKAIADGLSDQSVKAIIDGLLKEMEEADD